MSIAAKSTQVPEHGYDSICCVDLQMQVTHEISKRVNLWRNYEKEGSRQNSFFYVAKRLHPQMPLVLFDCTLSERCIVPLPALHLYLSIDCTCTHRTTARTHRTTARTHRTTAPHPSHHCTAPIAPLHAPIAPLHRTHRTTAPPQVARRTAPNGKPIT